MRVAYFTSWYPYVSHTFIRREICALETLGVTVVRYALTSPQDPLDAIDEAEQRKTRYLLKAGIPEITRCCLVTLFKQPLTVISVFFLAAKIGWRSDRGMLWHFIYAVEAILLAVWCSRDDIQHLHAHFGTNPAAVAMLASQLSGIPYSFTAHGPDEFDKAPLISLDQKLKRATFAICVSSFGKSQLMRWSSPDQWQRIEVVHCGVDSSFLAPELQPPPAVARFVCVGRITASKAQLVLVGAVRRLYEWGLTCEVVLVGDGPMRNQLEETVRNAQLERQITFVGWASGERVKAEILSARALVLPSFSENMPVVIMEAMALGRPVISTYIAGIPELIRPGHTGWLVPASDEIALAEAMREALAASVDELARMGAAGRRHVAEYHDSRKEATKLKTLFERSIARGTW